jgi:D-tyrosyl-tRNA(Tyr) deacylase
MRSVLQRVGRAEVRVDGSVVGAIESGLVVLLGVAEGDTQSDAEVMATKVAGLRVFPDDHGKMNRSVADSGGKILLVSQFTLLADVRKGRRPSFSGAARPEDADALVDAVAVELRLQGIEVATGRFGSMMELELINEGPVTIVIDVVGGSVVAP